jgi:dTDP-4-amino-4,6-dideoxygalactose transaminase
MPTCEESWSSADAQLRLLARRGSTVGYPGAFHLTGGSAVASLERKLCATYGRRHAVCVASATTGLALLGLVLGIRKREFVAPPLTWGGSVAPWVHLGGRVCFCDVNPDDFTLDPRAVVNGAREPAAILAVDIFGAPADSRALKDVARDLGAVLVVDGSQSLGARREGLPAGAHADVLVVSFTSGKVLDAGEGGALLTDDDDLYDKIIWHGQHPDRQRLQLASAPPNTCCLNARISPLSAVWADELYESALERLESRRRSCARAARHLRAAGMIEGGFTAVKGLESACFRNAALWSGPGGVPPQGLEVAPARSVRGGAVVPANMLLVPNDPSFCAIFRSRWRRAGDLEVARDIERRLVFLESAPELGPRRASRVGICSG